MTHSHTELLEFAKTGELPEFRKSFAQPDRDGWTAVHHAAMNGELPALERLSAWGLGTKELTPELLDAFDLALDHEHFAVCDWLIINGADLEPRPSGYNALDYPAMNGNLNAVSYLVAKGALVDGVTGSRPPIVWAAQEKHFEVFEKLLKQGASASKFADDLDEVTALTMSAADGSIEFLEAIFRITPAIEPSHLIAAAELAKAYNKQDAERLIRSKI